MKQTETSNSGWLRRLVRCHGHNSNPCGWLIRCVFNPAIHICKPALIGGTLCCLMLGNLAADPMPTTNQQQSEYRQSSASQIAAGKITDKDAAKISCDTTPSRDGFERLKAWFGENVRVQWFRVQLTIWLLSGFTLGYQTCKWRMEKIIKRMTPNEKS
jgi:hypothetical protein